jgi:hypothetical protein
VRPYELFPALSSLNQMAFYVGIVTLAVYFAVNSLSKEISLRVRRRST